MPQNLYHRLWCRSCQGWNLFSLSDKLTCNACGTDHEITRLTDIPEEKLFEQRRRYRESQSKLFSHMILGVMIGYADGNTSKIIESDAGQEEIYKKRELDRKERMENREIARKEKIALLDKFKGVGRNDKCACGSGIKFKKCCIGKIPIY